MMIFSVFDEKAPVCPFFRRFRAKIEKAVAFYMPRLEYSCHMKFYKTKSPEVNDFYFGVFLSVKYKSTVRQIYLGIGFFKLITEHSTHIVLYFPSHQIFFGFVHKQFDPLKLAFSPFSRKFYFLYSDTVLGFLSQQFVIVAFFKIGRASCRERV